MVHFGIEFLANETADTLADMIRFSEENGIEYAWITDHYNNRDSFSLLTYIAARTTSIKLGTGVTNPYTRTAPQLASAIATVDETSGGRAVFGIGPGDKMTFENLGVKWTKPLQTVRETVEVVRRLTLGEPVSFDGNVISIKKAKLDLGSRSVPVYIGAQGPGMLRLAGEIGDGALVNASHPRDFEFAVKLLKEGAAGRDFSQFDVGAYTSFSVAGNKDEAVAAARPVVAFITAGSPPDVIKRHDIPEEDYSRLTSAFKDGFKQAVRAVTDDMISAFSICGTPDDCIGQIHDLTGAGVTQVIPGSPLGPDKKKSIQLIGKEIIPEFKEE
ncbi:MAG: 5,10-methylenetetrahydromethanopterin reductase [ANME-2 cluster archaeon]|nr:5,10-methylenetetrahydromethanopterin reductase [ANME-2 cluster archaeon]MBC2702536.1 5,10-methylenetetrahydromethanopterin reductase [ANME-2 cluster archaeon]MBC2708883.1 5,10-methylenetetrahydromethanopterin reductase [ANME-2 cluster archaeon]MBC2746799.1 5,10-methylenetetrahydromethanopterin reductase [ANME-2 cluster archaeon]MBC2761742.1 5,10-methylenetetrahydromethanopterin reductase [ANME-2 cluster archaeon]